ncbi:thermonuclease family protein [Elioraea sp.]|uniref:thermonuclease family protein n=1 Tax=Elioraea sp. TaxID=2185103 RepID=UPI0025C32D13|nr:thermonuclease family protein [Elioraea sp.]
MSFIVRSFRFRNRAGLGLSGLFAALLWLAPGHLRAEEASPGALLAGPVPATLVRVIDGDTLVVRARVWLDLEVVTRVRLRGVNAPELRSRDEGERERAQAARAFIATLVDGAPLVLTAIGQDKYGGRVVATVTVAGEDLAAALLSEGHGRPMGPRGRRAPG